MNGKFIKNKYIVLLLIVGAVYFFLQYICPLVAPILIAILFLTTLYPTLDDIQKKTHIRKQFLAAIFITFFGLVIVCLAWIIVTVFLRYIPEFLGNADVIRVNINVFVRECCDALERTFGINAKSMERGIIENVNLLVTDFQGEILPGLLSKSWSYAQSFFSLGGFIGITVIATVLLAKDYDEILDKMAVENGSRMALEVVVRVIRYIATFVKAQLTIMTTVGGLCMLVLSLCKVENGALLGLLAGFLDVLPFIGTGIVLVPISIWQLLQGYYFQAAICIALYVFCILIREAMEPKLIGDKVGIYPVAILIAVYAGLKLFGIFGIFLGPLGLVIIQQIYRVFLRQVDEAQKSGYDETMSAGKGEKDDAGESS